jgi:AcrR family transcriptional regulator
VEPSTRAVEIAEAAERLFSARGYHATSVREVASAVNLQGGSLYAHFASKEGMLAAIVDRAAGEFQAAVQPIASASDESATSRLRRAIRAHVGVIAANPGAATVYFQDWRHLSPPARAAVLARRDAYEALWREMIAQGVDSGELAPRDPRLAAIACLSVCNWLYQWYDRDGPLAADEVADAFAEILLNGLAVPPGPAADPPAQGVAQSAPPAGSPMERTR